MSLVGRKIRVQLGGKTILHNVDFRANPGELIGILGPSGSGKSTLLRALSGFRPAREGQLTFRGRDLYDEFESLKHEIGFVPQDDIVPLALKVERVLAYAAELRLEHISPEERQQRVERILYKLQLTKSKNLRVSKLSGGQRKRVSVGVELLSNPKLLFADEPTSGLDPALERSLTEALHKLTQDGSIVIVTTHIMTSLDLLHKICVLHEGRLVFFGAPSDLKPFFEVEDFIEIYSKLQQHPASEWRDRYQRSPLSARYLM